MAIKNLYFHLRQVCSSFFIFRCLFDLNYKWNFFDNFLLYSFFYLFIFCSFCILDCMRSAVGVTPTGFGFLSTCNFHNKFINNYINNSWNTQRAAGQWDRLSRWLDTDGPSTQQTQIHLQIYLDTDTDTATRRNRYLYKYLVEFLSCLPACCWFFLCFFSICLLLLFVIVHCF